MNVLEEVGRYTINFADSAAVARMKIGNGSGESRLYVGQTTDQIKIRNFFFEDVRFYFFCINDILKYLNIAKEEYLNPSQAYQHKKEYPNFFSENLREIEEIQNDYLKLNFIENNDSKRCYLRLAKDEYSSKNYEILRKICIPKYTDIEFIKYINKSTNAHYIKIMPIFSKPYTADQLWSIFLSSYSSIKDRDVAIHVFIYEYGKYLLDNKLVDGFLKCSNFTDDEKKVFSKAVDILRKLQEDKISIYLSDTIILDEQLPLKEAKEIEEFKYHHQQIYYGAPGTGKSHETNKIVSEYSDTIRTTFHPDSDYSTFVGAYKPTTEKEYMYGLNGDKTVLFKDPSTDEPLKTSKIEYKFVKQAFLKAYIRAWLKMSKICSNTTSRAFVVSSGKVTYTIADVEPTRIVCRKEEGGFPKKLVKIVWDALWSTGKFVMPTGAQSGQSIQQAISQWIYDLYEVKDVKNFDKGWDEIITRLQKGNAIEVKKDVNGAQTYTLSDNGDKDTVKVTSLAGSSKEQIQKCYEGDKSRSTIKEIVKILKEYNLPTFEEAWEKFTDEVNNKGTTTTILVDDEVEPQFLVIEEINRGNCAQIFGDIFQLLDRKEGYSEYPIEADDDIRKALIEDNPTDGLSFGSEGLQLSEDVKHQINEICGDDEVADKVCNGKVLVLPPNLYIWATMNTSDQSLFPIDSAFKRRWDWQYMPISKGVDKDGNEMNWSIVIGKKSYDWWEFLTAINEVIGTETQSEDKKLGFFFCKADSKDEISVDKFVNKVLFYLWNDVFKTCGVEYHYKDGDDEKLLTFDKFHTKDGFDVKKIQDWLELEKEGLNLKDKDSKKAAASSTETPAEDATESEE